MANVGKIRKKLKAHQKAKEEREERRKSFVNWFQPVKGQNCIGILPEHPNMEELPYVPRGTHRTLFVHGFQVDGLLRRSSRKRPNAPTAFRGFMYHTGRMMQTRRPITLVNAESIIT